MSNSCRQSMDFEQWRKMASQDPEGFEKMRREMVEELIERSSAIRQQRLRGLQWRIDQVRVHSPNPMAACISLSSMMWESFAGEEGLADTLNRQHTPRKQAQLKAELIPFPRRPK
jgi:hypothetical protein